MFSRKKKKKKNFGREGLNMQGVASWGISPFPPQQSFIFEMLTRPTRVAQKNDTLKLVNLPNCNFLSSVLEPFDSFEYAGI